MNTTPDHWILAARVHAADAETIAAWMTHHWNAAPVEIARPNDPHVWLENYFADETEARLAAITFAQTHDLPWAIRSCAHRDWAEAWKHHFSPTLFGRRLWVCPTWRNDPPPHNNTVRIDLNPGLSFGTGNHFTTRFCLEAIDQHFAASSSPIDRMLDLGCGSGILSIAAAKLGCPHILAIEHDPLAVQACRHNLERNHVTHPIELRQHDFAERPLRGTWPLVVANIYDAFLIDHARAIAACTSHLLILSGIRTPHLDAVADAFLHLNLTEQHRASDPEWSGLILHTTG